VDLSKDNIKNVKDLLLWRVTKHIGNSGQRSSVAISPTPTIAAAPHPRRISTTTTTTTTTLQKLYRAVPQRYSSPFAWLTCCPGKKYLHPFAITSASMRGWFSSDAKVATPATAEEFDQSSVKRAVFSTELVLKDFDDLVVLCAKGDLAALKAMGPDNIRRIVMTVLANPLAPLETTPLHAAAANDQLEILDYLIQNSIMPIDTTLRPSTLI